MWNTFAQNCWKIDAICCRNLPQMEKSSIWDLTEKDQENWSNQAKKSCGWSLTSIRKIAKFYTKVGVNDYKSRCLIFTFVILCHFDKKLQVFWVYQKRNEKYRSFLGCKLSFLVVLVLLFEKCNTTGIVAKIFLLKARQLLFFPSGWIDKQKQWENFQTAQKHRNGQNNFGKLWVDKISTNYFAVGGTYVVETSRGGSYFGYKIQFWIWIKTQYNKNANHDKYIHDKVTKNVV